MPMPIVELLLALPVALGHPAAPLQEPAPAAGEAETEALDAGAAALIDQLVQGSPGPAEVTAATPAIYDAIIAAHGDLELADQYLAGIVASPADPGVRLAAQRLGGLLSWRLGDLASAAGSFEELGKDESDLDARLTHARLLDADSRSDEALEAYGKLVETGKLDERLESKLRLRMALMSMETGGDEQKDALAEFAREEGRPIELRNRCATVLALLGRPGDAADLYVVPDVLGDEVEIGARKKSIKSAANGELRVAEWALRAEDWERAQGAAWRAVHLSPVARERRYGLTLLAEAHRGDDSLPKLIERFGAEREGLPAEARRAWIELLRETGASGDAITMVQEGGSDVFSKEERRRLLEMYREAGRTDEMVATFREWIAAEPDELVWRSGLARHFLEAGDRDAAVALWDEWFALPMTEGRESARPLDVADALESLGLDQLARRAAELEIASGDEAESAFLFLYDLERDRGRLDEARVALGRLDEFADEGSPARMPLSDCLERLGELEEAVRVLEAVRTHRGAANAGEDLEMRLAWLYSEVGAEEKALGLWRDLWTRMKSLPRRRFVEDRLMTVASRLGVLADVAVELERKLYDGTATQKDTGLLVRLYTKVGDAVSAAEIIDEFLRRSGGTELEALTEKARIYLACNDYYHYEKAVAKLVALDPEGRPDYYRQLAMSQLERGKPDQARTTLMQLQDLPGGDDSAAEFEAGVLSLSGMREEAIAAYRRGLAAHPERIDSYLLMANLLKEIREADLAVGMFQHLAETAERDDLFTIAIDGLLNMLVDAPPRPKMVQWARRVTLERLAGTEDRPYLYQLLADLASETNDAKGQVAALENSLASAGPRRASVLRELMDLSKPARGSFGSPGREGNRPQQLAFGRRLVGLGELVPPEVYLDLGDAFLEDGDEGAAARTFDLTREFPDGELYQAEAAERFEKAAFVERALERYQAVLAASPTDVRLLAKVGELTESLGDDALAQDLYRRAYDVLLSRKTLFEGGEDEEEEEGRFFARNVDEFDQSIERVLQGVLATLSDDAAVSAFVAGEIQAIEQDLPAARQAAAQDRAEDGNAEALRFASLPRLAARAGIVRRVAFAAGHEGQAEAMDGWLLTEFPDDVALLEEALGARIQWGRFAAGRRLLESSRVADADKERLAARLGGGAAGASAQPGAARLPFDSAVTMVLAGHAAGDVEALRAMLRRVDFAGVEKEQLGRMAVLFAGARSTGDPQLKLSIAREWLRLDLEHKTYQYQLEERVTNLLAAMDGETGLALGRYFVGRVLDDPEANSSYVTILPKLARELGEEVVEVEAVRTLLDEFGQRYAWGLGPVLALLPPADRAGALRGVWSKLEASNRADFLLGLVSESTEEIPDELAEFMEEALPDAIGEADDFIQYAAGQLIDVEHSHALCARLAKIVREGKPELTFLEAVELIHRARGGEEGLEAQAAELWVDLAAKGDDDYQMRRTRDALLERFEDDHVDAFITAIGGRVDKDGSSPELLRARVDLLLDADRAEEARAALDAALAEEPDDTELLERLRRLHQRRGERIAAAEVLERLAKVAADEKDESTEKRHLKRLVSEWTSLRAPERALAAKEKLGGDEEEAGASEIPGFPPGFVLPPGATIVVNGVTYGGEEESKKKGLPKSFKEVREALGEDDADTAQAIFRRLWRQFPVGQPTPPRFFSARSYRRLSLANLRWPAEKAEAEAEGEEEPDEPSVGGLLAFDPNEPEDPPRPPSAYARLAEAPALVAEQRRFLRGLRAFELDRLQPLLEGLIDVEIAEAGGGDAGAAAVLTELLERAEAGETGRADQIRLLSMLSASPDRVTGPAAEALRSLVGTIPPRDAAQVLRLARVLHQSGDEELAARLYQWCALQSEGGRFGGDDESLDVVTSVGREQLVREAKEHLEGDAQIALIESVLELANPGDRPWERESYDQLVLSTWQEICDPVEALERSRSVAMASIDLGEGLRRRAARRAATVFAAAGEFDHALRAVEIGIAKLDPAEVTQPEETWYREDPTRPASLYTDDLRRLLPVDGGEIPDAAEWFEMLSDALILWLDQERIREASAVQPLALAAQRLAEAGRAEAAARIVARLAKIEGLSPGNELWLIDALRAADRTDAATQRERALLAGARLHPERVPAVVAAIAEAEGPAAALEAAAPVAEVSRHPKLVETLIAAAEAAGDSEAAKLWRERGAAAAAALEALGD